MNWLDYALLAIVVIGALRGIKSGILDSIVYAILAFLGWYLAGQIGPAIGDALKDTVSNDQILTTFSFIIVIASVLWVGRILWKIVKPVIGVATLGTTVVIDRAGGLILGLLIGAAIAGTVIIILARLTYTFDTQDVVDLMPRQLVTAQTNINSIISSLEQTVPDKNQLAEILQKTEQVKGAIHQDLTEAESKEAIAAISDLERSVRQFTPDKNLGNQLSYLSDLRETIAGSRDAIDEQVESVRYDLETALTESTLVGIFVDFTEALPGSALGFIPDDFKTSMDILKENMDDRS